MQKCFCQLCVPVMQPQPVVKAPSTTVRSTWSDIPDCAPMVHRLKVKASQPVRVSGFQSFGR